MNQSVSHKFHNRRFGNLYLVLEPNIFINDFYDLTMASTHGSPWRYDTYMPVMFAGSGLKGIAFDRQVTSHDIAAMQASYLGIKPPKASIGDLLAEVVGSKADE